MKILFNGPNLGKHYPQGVEVAGDTVMECMTALQNFPGFRREDKASYQVVIPGFGSRDSLLEKTEVQTIEVVEILEGAGGKAGTFLMVAVGVFLIATGVGAPGGVALLGTTIAASTLVSVGAMLVLQGVIALLTPAPERKSGDKEERSNYLSGAGRNTVRIGTRIPLVFGRVKLYGHYLSYNVTATDLIKPDDVKKMPADSGGQYMIGQSDYIVTNNTSDGL